MKKEQAIHTVFCSSARGGQEHKVGYNLHPLCPVIPRVKNMSTKKNALKIVNSPSGNGANMYTHIC